MIGKMSSNGNMINEKLWGSKCQHKLQMKVIWWFCKWKFNWLIGEDLCNRCLLVPSFHGNCSIRSRKLLSIIEKIMILQMHRIASPGIGHLIEMDECDQPIPPETIMGSQMVHIKKSPQCGKTPEILGMSFCIWLQAGFLGVQFSGFNTRVPLGSLF